LSRVSLAFRSFFSLLSSGKLPEDIVVELGLIRRISVPQTPGSAPKAEAEPAKPADGAVQFLGLLQQESRLVDFFMEDITPYSDEQVGQAMRNIHTQCKTVLERVMKLAPVIDGVEDTPTSLAAAGLSSKHKGVKLIGKVPPDGKVDSGILRHKGWKVERVTLPSLKAGEAVTIVAPAEVEVE